MTPTPTLREFSGFVAIGWDGKPRPWTVAHRRKDTMQAATKTMMGGVEYQELGTLGRRWAHCYRNGCRIVRARIIPAPPAAG